MRNKTNNNKEILKEEKCKLFYNDSINQLHSLFSIKFLIE